MNKLNNYLNKALTVVKLGSKNFDHNLNEYNKIEKNNERDIKLYGDRKLNKFLVDELKKLSTFNILSEEEDRTRINDDQYNWVLDPLDGSFNYARGIPIYCISLALCKGYTPVLGVIFDLMNKDIYFGIHNCAAYKNRSQIKVSKINQFSDAVLCTGFPIHYTYSKKNIVKFADNILKYKKIRLFGSAAMSLSFVASGLVDAYKEDNIMIWDVAAGIAIVQAAGGNVIYTHGEVENSLNVSATNGRLS